MDHQDLFLLPSGAEETTGSYIPVLRPKTSAIPETTVCKILVLIYHVPYTTYCHIPIYHMVCLWGPYIPCTIHHIPQYYHIPYIPCSIWVVQAWRALVVVRISVASTAPTCCCRAGGRLSRKCERIPARGCFTTSWESGSGGGTGGAGSAGGLPELPNSFEPWPGPLVGPPPPGSGRN